MNVVSKKKASSYMNINKKKQRGKLTRVEVEVRPKLKWLTKEQFFFFSFSLCDVMIKKATARGEREDEEEL